MFGQHGNQYSSMEYDSVFGVGHSSSSSYVDSNTTHTPTLMQRTITKTNPTMGLYSNIQPQNSYNFTIADSQGSNGIFESMNRATPYSPEEKKERIERYRSKRNLRNFNKKIKYECRKTLADSRPRVRGRFARNDDREKAAQRQWDSPFVDDDYSWINILDALNKSDAALISSF